MVIFKMIKNYEEQKLRELFVSVGLVNAIDDGELTVYAHYLPIRPEYQNMKIGSSLITRLKKMAFKGVEGAWPMMLQTL